MDIIDAFETESGGSSIGQTNQLPWGKECESLQPQSD